MSTPSQVTADHTMSIHNINPIEDPRWADLVDRHPRASAFHSAGWLRAIRQTYGYDVIAYTSSAGTGPLEDGLPFCHVNSWLTGRRLVSLPFSDHCEPLTDTAAGLSVLLTSLMGECRSAKYVELRPEKAAGFSHNRFGQSEKYFVHKLDLSPGSEALFRKFHKDCIQRKIRRAEREGVTYEEGRSQSLLEKFYSLMRLTRRRHKLPPQPIGWFSNVLEHMGENARIWVASGQGRSIASILTLQHKGRFIYKYGCSDENFHRFGAMPFLFWQMIQHACAAGGKELDFGRSDCDQPGLIAFKEHWGAVRSDLIYLRSPAPRTASQAESWPMRVAQQLFHYAPDPVIALAGKVLYRHIG